MDVVLRITKRCDSLKLAPHLNWRQRQKLQRLKNQIRHRVIGGAAAKTLDRLPVVAADIVLAADANLINLAEARIGHHGLRQKEVWREKPALKNKKPIFRFESSASQ